MSHFKVSVCCITYNHGPFLRSALDGFLSQKTSFPYEIIVHDDASTDETSEILDAYSKRFPDIVKVITQPSNIYSKGIKPLRICTEAAQGEYIALCEGDDRWEDEEKLEKQYQYMVDNQGCSVSFHRSVREDESSNLTLPRFPASSYRNYSRTALLLGKGGGISTLTMMAKKRCFELPKEYDFVVNEDSFIFVNCGRFGSAGYVEDIKPAIYRVHPGGIWSARENNNKIIKSAETYFWISRFLYREEGLTYSSWFVMKAIKLLVRVLLRDFNRKISSMIK